MDTSPAAATAAATRALLLLGLLGLNAAPSVRGGGGGRLGSLAGKRQRSCPAVCHCEPDGMLQRVDCSDLGLTGVPANLSVFTSYLDLSMNNISKLPSNSLHSLRFLEELRLAGNGLTHIPKGAFAGLFSLKVLMLQNNLLRQVPTEALQNLHTLQSLRLDANHISFVPPNCFSGLISLRHLWLDDNSMTEIPVQAFRSLPALQAMTLALNKIHHIPDYAFGNLSSLVVLHLHNNRICSLGTKCFDGLHSLETLDLNYNNLDEFPTSVKALRNLKELGFHSNNIKSIPEQAFMGNPSLIAIHFYDNPIQIVGRSAFQHLPELRTLTLNGASQITEFPDLTGTKSLESLTITGAQIISLPETICDQLPSLQVLDLSYNQLNNLPHFTECDKLQKINLHHNEISEIRADTFQQLVALRSLDLSSNLLSSFPVTGLYGLTHLKLTGNHALQSLISSENFPELKVIEMPYAYQCCAFGACDSYYKIQSQWNKYENSSADVFQRKDAGIFHTQDDHDFEDFLLDFDEDLKAHHSVQCSPSPGPFKPCSYLFGSWLIRLGVWTIVVLAFLCNTLVIATIFKSPLFISSVKLLIGLIAVVNTLMGVSSSVLAGVDALTFGVFAHYGAWWEGGVGCHIVGLLSIFASEASIFLLTLAALERGFPVRHATKFETKPNLASMRIAIFFCFLLALIIAVIPIFGGIEYGVSPLCTPLPFGKPTAVGYMVALVLLNSLCFLVMTVAYTKLYCSLDKGELDNIWDCSMVKHIAFLLFTNCILYCPVAILSFSSLLNLTFISSEVIKPILLVIVPLPACLNPLLYILFNPHFKEDLGSLRKQTFAWKASKHASLVSVNSEDAEKQSCDSTQALVTFASTKISYDVPANSSLVPPSYQIKENCNLSSVTFVPCH
ncbi:leucine-rich repeat-containing G-protein coupled receptor 5 isoform X2 [Hemicordylus capensis]|uniref:leucine-rich repeat-containing G-protein coupled receptor 5 isoform X2 n=1 Tax=Hemicordylus capensis TaxID=884348 RepID=UPI0023047B08|nr:leucine-rich repeat-containing G-protein coupled receptor 5 isoform X2 [Hemicordylus capensis]